MLTPQNECKYHSNDNNNKEIKNKFSKTDSFLHINKTCNSTTYNNFQKIKENYNN